MTHALQLCTLPVCWDPRSHTGHLPKTGGSPARGLPCVERLPVDRMIGLQGVGGVHHRYVPRHAATLGCIAVTAHNTLWALLSAWEAPDPDTQTHKLADLRRASKPPPPFEGSSTLGAGTK